MCILDTGPLEVLDREVFSLMGCYSDPADWVVVWCILLKEACNSREVKYVSSYNHNSAQNNRNLDLPRVTEP